MGISSSVLWGKKIKSRKIKNDEKTINSPEIKHKKSIKTPQKTHEKPIEAKPEIKHKKPIKNHEKPIEAKPESRPGLSYYCTGVREEDPIEFANACLIEIDTTSLKIDDYASYCFLLSFHDRCRYYHNVSCFFPNRETYKRSVLKGLVIPEDMNANDHATAAIYQYNNLTQNGKLKLERVIDSACYCLDRRDFFYILFNATDMESNTQSVYQVAMTALGGQPVLGLLRDFSNSKILALISLKGADDDIAVKKRNLVSSQATGFKS